MLMNIRQRKSICMTFFLKSNQKFQEKYHLKSQLLHSYQLVMPDITGCLSYLSNRTFYAPLPENFKIVLEGEGLWQHGILEENASLSIFPFTRHK